MAITLYELAGADPDVRFSPYCWRIRLALAHKGLPVDGLPWRFTEKDRLKFANSERVPVLVDDGKTVVDSWAIAEYLDTTYPDRPILLGPAAGHAHLRFLNSWTDSIVHGAIARMVLKDIHDILAPVDQAYFRQTRERAMGKPLEDVVAERETVGRANLAAALAPVRTMLRLYPWLGGAAPDYADYILLGSLQWARCVSRFDLLAADDPVLAWQQKGLALFDGLLANAKRA